MADYESVRLRHGMRMLELLPELFEHLTWPIERLGNHREAKLRALVAHARAHSP